MSMLVHDCPRCGAKNITFDILEEHLLGKDYGWQRWYETFCLCRNCDKTTTFVLSQYTDENTIDYSKGLKSSSGTINNIMRVENFVSTKEHLSLSIPAHLPNDIEKIFKEGSACFAIYCYNAAATMFRLCLDISTRGMLPDSEDEGLNHKVRRNLGLRLPWLFIKGKLPADLQNLSTCVKDDGNDGAHEGTLTKADAEDLLDFTTALLKRIYTEPARLRLAEERRLARRNQQ